MGDAAVKRGGREAVFKRVAPVAPDVLVLLSRCLLHWRRRQPMQSHKRLFASRGLAVLCRLQHLHRATVASLPLTLQLCTSSNPPLHLFVSFTRFLDLGFSPQFGAAAMDCFDGRDIKTLQVCISDLSTIERYLDEQQGLCQIPRDNEQQRQHLKDKVSDMLLKISRLSYAIASIAEIDTGSIAKVVEDAVAIVDREWQNGHSLKSSLDQWLQSQGSIKLLTGELVSQVLKRLTNDKSKSLMFYKWADTQPGFRHTSTTLNCVVKSYLRAEHVKAALDLVTKEHKSVTDASTYQLVVPRLKTGQEMIQTLALMHKSGVKVEIGLCKRALRMFLEDDPQEKCSLLVVCSLLELCERAGSDDAEAWDLLLKAASKGRLIQADETTGEPECILKSLSSTDEHFMHEPKRPVMFVPGFSFKPSTSEEEDGWFYLDPQGTPHGPFPLQQLREWNSSGLFPSDLKVWKKDESGVLTVPLRDVLERGVEREPRAFKVAQNKGKTPSLNPLADEFKPPSKLT